MTWNFSIVFRTHLCHPTIEQIPLLLLPRGTRRIIIVTFRQTPIQLHSLRLRMKWKFERNDFFFRLFFFSFIPQDANFLLLFNGFMKFLNIQRREKGAKNKLTSLSTRQLCVGLLPSFCVERAEVNDFFLLWNINCESLKFSSLALSHDDVGCCAEINRRWSEIELG